MILLQQPCPSGYFVKQFSNSIFFVSKLNDNEFSLFVLKAIHRQLALFDSKSTCYVSIIQ